MTRADLPLAHLAEASSVLDAEVERHDPHYHLTYLRVPGGQLAVSLHALPVGAATRVRIQARDVSLALEPPRASSISNVLPAQIRAISPDQDPAQVLVQLDLMGCTLLARITRRSADVLALTPGCLVYAQVKSVAVT